MFTPLLEKVVRHEDLTAGEAAAAMREVMEGRAAPAALAALLTGLVMLARRGIDTILLLSPTTTDVRLRRAAELGSGFLYAISRLGVTGARDSLAEGAQEMVRRIRTVSDLPVALGFGISKPDHVREVGQWADAAVVGSALVDVIAREGASRDLNTRVEEYVRWLKS